MSTRCTINFENGNGRHVAKVYRHCDGYPEGILPDLQDFFQAVEDGTRDTRFGDASYLAAKFIVWQAMQYARTGPLDFLSIGILEENPGDIEYTYSVRCHGNGRPTVKSRKI